MGGGSSKPRKSLETRRRDRRIARNRREESTLLSIDDKNQRSIRQYQQNIPNTYQQFKQSFNDRNILQSIYKSLLKELEAIRRHVRKLEGEIKILNKQRDDAKKLTKEYKEEIKRLNDIIRALNTMIIYLKRIERALNRQIEILDNQLKNTDQILEEEMIEFYRLDAYIKDLFFKANTAKPLAEKYGQVYFNSLQQQNHSLIQSNFELGNIQTRSNRLYLYSDSWFTKIDSVYEWFLFLYLFVAVLASYFVVYKSTYLTNSYFKIFLAIVIITFPFYIIPLENGIVDFFRVLISLFLGKPYEKNNWI
jgi:small-conductance mechanosensitive channel